MRLDRSLRLLLLLPLFVAGCHDFEATQYGYLVVNYSPNAYVVNMTYSAGDAYDLAVAPHSRTSANSASAPADGVVYDAACSRVVAKVSLVAPGNWIFIDGSGNLSTPATMTSIESNAVPYVNSPLPSSCQ